MDPKLIIADEPTSALDASIQAKILRLFLDLQEERGLALLLITHDIALARKVSDRMAVMLQGTIVEEGPTSEIVNNPIHPYTKCLTEAAPTLSREINDPLETNSRAENNRETIADTQKGSSDSQQNCPFIRRCPQPLPRCFQDKPELKACSVHRVACFLKD